MTGRTGLRVRDLVTGYASRVDVLRSVSIDVGPGDAVSLLGPNGAGKTTLLRTISGLLRPRGGSIHLGDDDLGSVSPHAIARRGVAHVPEGRQLFARQTVRDNLLLGAMRSREAGDRLEQVLATFPVLRTKLDRPGGELSGGQQQILAIARGLMSRPRLLILDEPSLGLSPQVADDLLDLLHRVRDEFDTALLMAEQSAAMAAAATNRAYVMRRGKIVLEGDSRSLLGNRELISAYLR